MHAVAIHLKSICYRINCFISDAKMPLKHVSNFADDEMMYQLTLIIVS